MSKAKGIKEVAYIDVRQAGGHGGGHAHTHTHDQFGQQSWFDCAGGGQVVVERNIAYVGNMRNPAGTLVIDVSDPKRPRQIGEINMPPGTHSHKVRVHGDIMITNREVLGGHALKGETPPAGYTGGISIWDVSNPAKHKLITNWDATDNSNATYARGVHRFDFDGRYAYISPTMDGYIGNIVLILDLKNPAKPEEVGRWHLPGQWVAGGEKPTWKGSHHKCHHPLRVDNRLYTGYWYGGFVILDIDDMSKPKLVSHVDWSPPFPWPTHTCLKMPFKIQGRDIMIVSDEDVGRLEGCNTPYPAAFLWVVDISDERNPVPISSFQLEDMPDTPQPTMTGCHQPAERIINSTEIPVAWFAHGLRVIDVAKPHAPKEIAYFLPDVPPGCDRVQSNDVTVDERGLIYLLDRVRGLHILERV